MTETPSPQWGSSIKLVVGLTAVAIVAALLVRFRDVVGPLLLAIVLAYLLHPLISWISRTTRMPWRTTVNLLYLVIIVLLVSLITATGVGAVQQTQALFRVIEAFVTDLPELLENLSEQVYLIGPFQIDMRTLIGESDVQQLANQVLSIVQPVLGQAGSLIGSIASGTFSTLGWLFFIVLVSYFTLADSGNVPDMLAGLMSNIDIPGYQEDMSRLGRRLGRIWNAFMRGQLILFLVTVVVALLLMTALGVRNALALAMVAGVARFIPYVGPFVTWLVTALVAFFQTSNYFGLEPFAYAALVVIVLVLWDQVIDNLVTPRLYGQALGVHPAAVLIAAIIAANLLGLIGLLFAAPVLATLMLFGRYAIRKMFDLDPWPAGEIEQTPPEIPGGRLLRRALTWIRTKIGNNKRKQNNEQPEP